jgi:hypothetical protein
MKKKSIRQKEIPKIVKEDIKADKKQGRKKITASNKFIAVLALVSIIGFIGIVSETLFDFNLVNYVEAAWILIVGIGLILEGKIQTLKIVREEGLTPTNFAHIITLIVGLIAVVTGILSFPQIAIQTPGFLAVKGIISVIAIIVIIIQTWIVE